MRQPLYTDQVDARPADVYESLPSAACASATDGPQVCLSMVMARNGFDRHIVSSRHCAEIVVYELDCVCERACSGVCWCGWFLLSSREGCVHICILLSAVVS